MTDERAPFRKPVPPLPRPVTGATTPTLVMPPAEPPRSFTSRIEPPPPSPEKRAIAYAQALLFEKGPEAVSMTEAIAASGVSRRTLYKRFSTREALVRAAIQDVLDGTEREIVRNDEFGDSFRERLRDLGLALARRQSMFQRLVFSRGVRELGFYDAVVGAWLRNMEARTVAIVRQAQQRGELPKSPDAALAGFAAWSVIKLVIDGSFSAGGTRTPEEQLLALDFVVGGLTSAQQARP